MDSRNPRWTTSRYGLLTLFLFVAMMTVGRSDQPYANLRVMSFNIRYGTANDGANHWNFRRDLLVETIANFDPDLLGTQETLADQRDFLLQQLDGYEAVGVGRDDGKEGGEMAALFYRKDRFEALDSGHFWLSETPDQVGSKGWDAALPRIATWVKLRDRSLPDAAPILFLNSHFDHLGQQARTESARLIRTKLSELGSDCRWIVTGDFNADPSAPPYKELFASAAGNGKCLIDTYRAHRPKPQRDEGTFSGFNAKQVDGARIDWIGCSKDFDVRLADIDHDAFEGRTPSDHFPVTAVLRPRSPETEGTLRVMTYNIHHGEGVDGRTNLDRISALIRRWDPDVVALQEVDHETRRASVIQQINALSRSTGLEGRFARAIDFDEGQYGQALLARVPIDAIEIHRLPNAENREQRIAAEATLKFGDHVIRFVTTHLDHADQPLRLRQSSNLNELFGESTFPVVLAGDLNATPDSEVLRTLSSIWDVREPLGVHATFPSEKPTARLDYILTRSIDPVHVSELVAIDEVVASDHRPVMGILKWR